MQQIKNLSFRAGDLLFLSPRFSFSRRKLGYPRFARNGKIVSRRSCNAATDCVGVHMASCSSHNSRFARLLQRFRVTRDHRSLMQASLCVKYTVAIVATFNVLRKYMQEFIPPCTCICMRFASSRILTRAMLGMQRFRMIMRIVSTVELFLRAAGTAAAMLRFAVLAVFLIVVMAQVRAVATCTGLYSGHTPRGRRDHNRPVLK